MDTKEVARRDSPAPRGHWVLAGCGEDDADITDTGVIDTVPVTVPLDTIAPDTSETASSDTAPVST